MSRMANAGVETGANMLGVDTGPLLLSDPVAPTALEISAIRSTITPTESARPAAQNPPRRGRSTALPGASSTDLVAWSTYSSLLFACGPLHYASVRFQPPQRALWSGT